MCEIKSSANRNAENLLMNREPSDMYVQNDYVAENDDSLFSTLKRATFDTLNLPTSVLNLLDNLSDTSHSVKNVLDKISGFIPEGQEKKQWIAVAAILYLLYNGEKTISSVLAATVAIMLQFEISAVIVDSFKKRAMEFLASLDLNVEFWAQDNCDVPNTIGVVGLICMVIPVLFGKSIPSVSYITAMLASFGRAKIGVDKVGEIWNWIKDKHCEYFYGKTAEQMRCEAAYPGLVKYTESATVICEIQPRWIDVSSDICKVIIDTYRAGEEMYHKLKSDKTMGVYINSVQRKLLPFYEKATGSPANTTIERPYPLSIYLYGRSGVGKTTFQQMLVAKLYNKYFSNSVFPLSRIAFSRKCENEFFDGWNGQEILVYDDLYQAVDSINSPNPEILETIRVINDDPFHLHMSAVEDKKNYYLTSNVVIGTSNCKVPRIVSISCPDAVYRRWKLCVEVKVKPEYGKNVRDTQGNFYYAVDPAKVKNPLSTEFYELHLYRMSDEQTVKVMDFDEFVDLVFQSYEENKESRNLRNELLAKMAGVELAPEQDDLAKWKQAHPNFFAQDHVGPTYSSNDFTGPEMDAVIQVMRREYVTSETDAFYDTYEELDDDGMPALPDEGVSQVEGVVTKWRAKATAKVTAFSTWFTQFMKAVYGKLIKPIMAGIVAFLCPIIFSLILTWYCKKKPTCALLKTERLKDFYSSKTSIKECGCTTCSIVYDTHYRDFQADPSATELEMLSFSHNVLMTAIYNGSDQICGKLVRFLISDRAKLLQLSSQAASGDFITRNTISQIASGDYITRNTSQIASGDYTTSSTSQQCTECKRTKKGCMKCHSFRKFYSEDSEQARSEVRGMCARNMVRVSHDGIKYMRAIYVTGRVLLVPNHFISQRKPFFYVFEMNDSEGQEIRKEDCKIHHCVSRDGVKEDMALVGLPPYVPCRPDIIKHFILPQQRKSVKNFPVIRIAVCEGEVEMATGDIINSFSHMQYTDFGDGDTKIATIGETYVTDCKGGPGMCGSPYFTESPMAEGKIVGIHVAGDRKAHSVMFSVSQDYLRRNMLLAGFSQRHLVAVKSESYVMPATSVALAKAAQVTGSIVPVGYLIKKANQPTKTSLAPSLVQESGEWYHPISKPAHLKPGLLNGELCDPLIKGIKKVCGTQVVVPENILKIAANDVACRIGYSKTKGRVLTYEQSIEGIPGDDLFPPVNRSSSPGYPYNLNNKGKGKQHWLGDGEYVFDNAQLKHDVEQLIEDAKNNKRGEVLFSACLKDERRPLAKVDEFKTRVFEAAPMHYVLAVRQYYLDFVAHLMRNKTFNEVCVGINPFSRDWDVLAKFLKSKGDKVIAGDFSNFDGSLNQRILWEICDIINDWYDDGEENRRIRSVLFEEIVNTRVVVRDALYQQTHSQPSGNPLTVIVNSLFNMIVMRMAYLICKKEAGMSMMCDFTNNVALATYGDDNVLNIHDRAIDWYNQTTITKALKQIGLTYTDEAKTGVITPYRSLSEVSFLKRSFVESNGIYRGPLDLAVIREMCNWIRCKDVKESTRANCIAASAEFALHGRDVYEEHVHRLHHILRNMKCVTRFSTFDEWEDYYQVCM